MIVRCLLRFVLLALLMPALAHAQRSGAGERAERAPRRAVDPATLPVEPIARVTVDADRDTVPDRRGRMARVRGIVVIPTGVMRTRGLQALVQDASGGMGVYNRALATPLAAGDVVEAWGEVAQYRGAVQLQNAGVRVIGRTRVPPARAVPVAEADGWTHMGRRVRVEGVVGDLALDSWGVLRLTGDDRGMVSLFVPPPLTPTFNWKRFPRGTRVAATGVLSIYKPTWPYDGGFQVVLASSEDLVVLEPPTPAWQRWVVWGLLAALVVVAVAGLMQAWLQRRQRTRDLELKTLSALSAALANTDVGEEQLARNACGILTAYGVVDAVLVQALDAHGHLQPLALSGTDPKTAARLAPGGTTDASTLPAAIGTAAGAAGVHLLALHALPGAAATLGFLVALSPRARRANQMQERILLSTAKLLAMALDNRRMQERARQERQELEQLVITDELTRLYNRRFLDEYLRVQVPLAERRGGGLAFLAIDIDHFKRVNDTWGHEAGDRVLAGVASLLRGAGRSGDLPVRLGGEEFLFVIAEHEIDGALAFAERLRAAIAGHAFADVVPGQTLRVTVSVGVAMFGIHGATAACLLRASDEAMYASKRGGRDRVTLSNRIETVDP